MALATTCTCNNINKYCACVHTHTCTGTVHTLIYSQRYCFADEFFIAPVATKKMIDNVSVPVYSLTLMKIL